MYILDKNKDYYDYFSHIYGEDKNITFDRRGSIICKDENLVGSETIRRSERTNNYKNVEQYIILEIGSIQYLIKMDKFRFTKNKCNCNDFYDCSMKIVNIFRNNKNITGFPIGIRLAEIPWNGFSWYKKKTDEPDYSTYIIKDSNVSINLPILKDTQITHLINPEDIWKELSNYISSLKNDKNSMYVPDIQKVVNHGFDKNKSFRNMI